jgi:phosphoglycerate kinase
VGKPIEEGYMIVDYVPTHEQIDALYVASELGGRILSAGVPGIITAGYTLATSKVIETMRSGRGMLLGGDTVAEVQRVFFPDAKSPDKMGIAYSTGGGSALHYIAHGTTPVAQAHLANQARFP